jgi:hypothetical protein
MPTLRLIYLTEQQYADMTEDKRNNTTTAASEFPTTIKHIHDEQSRFPIDDATRNASSNNKELPAVGGETYAPVVEAELRKTSPLDSSGVVIWNTALTASRLALDHSSATDETIMNVSNEDTNTGASPTRVSAIAAATLVHTRRKVHKTFDERFKDLMAFKSKFGHCNVPCTKSSTNKHLSLGQWCGDVRRSYKAIKEGGTPRNYKLSKADMKRLENAGFEWNHYKKFDERFKDLMAFKAEFGHCNVTRSQSNINKNLSLGKWCSHVRQTYKAIKEGGTPRSKLSKADMKRLEKAGFEWRLK